MAGYCEICGTENPTYMCNECGNNFCVNCIINWEGTFYCPNCSPRLVMKY